MLWSITNYVHIESIISNTMTKIVSCVEETIEILEGHSIVLSHVITLHHYNFEFINLMTIFFARIALSLEWLRIYRNIS